MDASPEADLITLIVPPGAENAAISHGTQEFIAYQAAHLGHGERWLVDVPREAAQALLHNGGFRMADTGSANVVEDGRVALVAPSADSAASYESAGDGAVWVPTELAGILIESHGFKVPGAAAELEKIDAALAERTAQMAKAEERHANAVKAISVMVQDRDEKIADLDARLAAAVTAGIDKDAKIEALENQLVEHKSCLDAAEAKSAALEAQLAAAAAPADDKGGKAKA